MNAMTHTCPTCGLSLAENHPHGAEFIEEPGATPPIDHRVLLFGAVLLIVVLLVAVRLIDRGGAQDGDRDPEQDESDQTAGDGLDATGIPAEELSAERLETSRAVLRSLVGDVQLGYLGDDGVVFVDSRSGADSPVTLSPENIRVDDLLGGFAPFTVLNEGTQVFAIDHRGDLVAYRLSNAGPLVAGPDDEFAIIGASVGGRHDLYIGSSGGAFMTRLAVPIGTVQVNAHGLGVLIVASTGETFRARASEFVPFSEWPVVAATVTHHVEVRCVQPLECTPVLVDREADTAVELPNEFAGDEGDVVISPDGSMVMVANTMVDRVFDVATMALTLVESGAEGLTTNGPAAEVVWAADSSFVAWLEPGIDRPLLQVLDPAEGRIESIDLTELGAPRRAGNAVVLLP